MALLAVRLTRLLVCTGDRLKVQDPLQPLNLKTPMRNGRVDRLKALNGVEWANPC